MKGPAKTGKPAAKPAAGGLSMVGTSVKGASTAKPATKAAAPAKAAPAKAPAKAAKSAPKEEEEKKAPAKPAEEPPKVEAPVVVEEVKAEPIPEPVKGEVTVKYNHYKEKFPITDGVLLEELINEQYCLSYAFKGNYQLNLREDVKCAFEDRRYYPKHPTIAKAWYGLED